MVQQCTHTFTPEYPDFLDYAVEGTDDEKRNRWVLDESVPGVEDGTWSCPHDSVPDEEKCPFHLPVEDRPADVDATAEFLDRLESVAGIDDRYERRRHVQFVDATFESFDVSGEILDSGITHYLNLSHAEIHDADLTHTKVRQPIRFAHAQFVGTSRLRSATFEGKVCMRNVTFSGSVRLRGAVFQRSFVARHGTFEDEVQFWFTRFDKHAIFKDADFYEYAYFKAVDFDNYVRFSEARFHDDAWFELAEFGDDADFEQTRFDGEHSFIDAEFERTTNFSGITAAGPMDLSGASIEELQILPDGIREATQYVDLSESVVESGELSQPPEGDILYDFERATLGEVEMTTPNDEPIIDHIRLVRTSFDRFEFENDDMDPQAAGWNIHDVFDESLLPERRRGLLSAETLLDTYLKAKNGAKEAGNTTAVGAFYYKEMTYRRKHLSELITTGDGDGLRTAFDWVRNSSLMVVMGYGEYPLRIVGSSMATVLAFAAVYTQLQDISLTDSVLFSFQSFITFIVGSPPQDTSQLMAALSAFEGFTGAFFIALFVYAFTRKLNR